MVVHRVVPDLAAQSLEAAEGFYPDLAHVQRFGLLAGR
jgi:hypothetical protein